uniref:Uncharacterized protein n=1 Tax=Nicotiana tabacum TaxID=4097 RepID=A0A1S3XQA6_TOBAC|nr:PREDICTED: uncharacterized protein LOC107767600 [Nicotiana tabacum]
MADKLVTAHAGAKKAESRVNDIFAFRQLLGEGLRDFLARFNRLMKYPPTTWEEIHNAYCTEVRADKDDHNGPTQRLTSVQTESRKDRCNDGAGSQNQGLHSPIARSSEHAEPRAPEGANERSGTSQSRGREQHQGPPKPPFLAHTFQMIINGGDEVAINPVKFTTTHKLKWSITHEQYDDLNDSIIFDKSDTHGLTFPHFDALVINLRISDTDIKIIMVDDGNSACIIHSQVLMQMRLEDKIVPRCIILTGFNNAVERTSAEITLPVLAGGVTLETTFHFMNQDIAYNAIIGKPWIHAMRAIPSSLYQIIKFPTSWGIFSIRGK